VLHVCCCVCLPQVVDVREGSYESASKLELPGHRSDVRCLALSSNNTQLLSGSNAGEAFISLERVCETFKMCRLQCAVRGLGMCCV
jgi:WD40 repeat protein